MIRGAPSKILDGGTSSYLPQAESQLPLTKNWNILRKFASQSGEDPTPKSSIIQASCSTSMHTDEVLSERRHKQITQDCLVLTREERISCVQPQTSIQTRQYLQDEAAPHRTAAS